jgi:hypothetical protein
MRSVSTLPAAERRSSHVSSDPQCFIAYAPRGVGLLCALVYTVRGDDVCGWWLGPVNAEYQPSFFQLVNYFSQREHTFYATRGGDLYGGWVYDYDATSPLLDNPVPVDDALCHELEHMQFVFAQEWLSFAGDEDAEQEARRYHEGELAHQDVNVKFHRLNKLDKDQPVWVYRSAGFASHILKRLKRNWPLECACIET